MLPFVVLIMVSILGTAAPVFSRFALIQLPPLTIATIRFVCALLIIFPIWYRKKEYLKRGDIPKVVPLGVNVGLFTIGIQYTSVTMGAVLYTIVPLLVAILGYLIFREKLTRNNIIGLVVSLFGVGILFQGSINTNSLFSFGTPLGNLIILIAVISWAFFLLCSRTLSKSYSLITILFYSYLVATILLIFIVPFEWIVRPVQTFNLTPIVIGGLIGLVVSTVVTFYLYQWLIKNTSAFVASLSQYGQVASSAIAGIILFQEYLTSSLIIGTGLVLSGVFIATTYQHIKNRKKSAVVQ